MSFKPLLTACFLFFVLAQTAIAQQNVECLQNTTISTANGTNLYVCQGDGVSNTIRFRAKIVPTPSAYVVTDDAGTILYVSVNPTINFENLPAGSLRVYAISYIGQLLAAPGMNIFTDELGSICHALTVNYVTINNVSPDGGTVAAEGGSTTIVICANDATPGLYNFTTTSTSPLYAYLVTDINNIILEVSTTGAIDFSNLTDGTVRVWGFAYVGTITAAPGQDATTASLSTDCFDLSDNFVKVDKTTPDGSTVSLDNDSTSVEFCNGTNIPDLVLESQTTSAASYGYLLTDGNGVLVEVLAGNTIDFNALAPGAYRAYGVSYTGVIISVAGDTIATDTLADGCYELSSNFVSILKRNLDGGTVSLSNLATAATVCDNDGVSDELTIITSVTDPEEQYIFIITNELNNIIGTSDDGVIDFEGSGPGISRVWGLAYSGNLTITPGQNAETTNLSDECFQLSSNYVEIENQEALGGTVTLENGDTTIDVCAGDGLADGLTFTTEDGIGENYTFFLTDEDNVILSISTNGVINFENQDGGTYRVFGAAYSGDLEAEVGDTITTVVVSLECYEVSTNFVEVEVEFVDGGTVSLQGGGNSAVICANDAQADILGFDFTTDALNADYTFIITDANNEVLQIVAGNTANFNELAADSISRVWGVSFTGQISIEVGDTVGITPISTRCYELSSNFVEIEREETNGGTVAEASGDDTFFVCPDGTANLLSFSNTGISTGEYIYVITDEINTIVSFSVASEIDFDVMAEGTYRVYGLAYTGSLTAVASDNAVTSELSDQCFDLSDNFITVVTGTPDGGALSAAGGLLEVYSCPDDNEPDVVTFDNTGTSDFAYAIVVTDENDIVVGINEGNDFDFGTLESGVYHVYGIAYTGTLTVVEGDELNNVDLSDECFDLSDNFVTVTHQSPEGGEVALAGGATTIYLCPDGAGSSLLFFESNGDTGPGFVYIITDDDNIIVAIVDGNSINLDNLPEGSYRAWGLAYTGTLTAAIGDDASGDDLSSGCFALSSNFVTIVNQAPEGGTISGQNGVTEFDICTGDGEPNVIDFTVTNNTLGNYAYFITDQDGFLIGTVTDDSFDFEGVSLDGPVRVYGVAYTGDLLLLPGDDILANPASNDCYDLTDNFIDIDLTIVDGNIIFSDVNGTETLYICAGDGVADTVSFFTGTLGAVADYRFVITNENNVILAYMNGNFQNFEATAGFDRLRIWGLAYTGTLNATPFGQNINNVALSNGCFDLSDNFIDVFRDLPEGGEISSGGETEILLCIGAEDGVLTFETTSGSSSGYVYLVTSENDEIIQVSETGIVNFNDLQPGTYHIWGLSYTGVLTAAEGQEITPDAVLATSCFELSAGFVTVIRAEPVDGGSISDITGETSFVTCPDDDNGDLIILQTTSLDTGYVYVITDDAGNIIIPHIVGDVIDFDAAAPGSYRIYGISYNGTQLYGFGTNVLEDALSDICYVTSLNYISVVVAAPEGGTVATTDGETVVNVINGDGEPDVVGLVSTGASPTPYAYIITDEDNVIVALPDGNSYDFEELAARSYRFWGVAYTGALTAEVGDTLAVNALSDDCFDLSDNFVQVISEPETFGNPDSGTPAQAETATTTAPVASSLRLSPNPASVRLVADLTMSSIERPTTMIRIISATGQVVMQWNESAVEGANRHILNINDLVPGLYVLQATNGGVVETAKFTKQ